jgi:hypothetical protein
MSGSMAPGPPVRRASPGYYVRFGLIIAIGFLWTNFNPIDLPGPEDRPSEDAKERYCIFGHPADVRQSDGTYTCEFGHKAWEQKSQGTIKEKEKEEGP